MAARTQEAQNKTFAGNFRVALAASGMTQEAFAREVGVTLRSVSKWANAESEPKGRQFARLCDLLGRDASWFYADHEPNGAAA